MSYLEQLQALQISVEKLYALAETRPSISSAGDPLSAPAGSATHQLLVICEEDVPSTWNALKSALQLQYGSAPGVVGSSIEVGGAGVALTLETLEKFRGS